MNYKTLVLVTLAAIAGNDARADVHAEVPPRAKHTPGKILEFAKSLPPLRRLDDVLLERENPILLNEPAFKRYVELHAELELYNPEKELRNVLDLFRY